MMGRYFQGSTDEDISHLVDVWWKVGQKAAFVGDNMITERVKAFINELADSTGTSILRLGDDDYLFDPTIIESISLVLISWSDVPDKKLWTFIEQVADRGRYYDTDSAKDYKTALGFRMAVLTTPAIWEQTKDAYGRDPKHLMIHFFQ